MLVFSAVAKVGPEDGGSMSMYLPTSPHGVTTLKTNINIFMYINEL
jgi:hypothetical protein